MRVEEGRDPDQRGAGGRLLLDGHTVQAYAPPPPPAGAGAAHTGRVGLDRCHSGWQGCTRRRPAPWRDGGGRSFCKCNECFYMRPRPPSGLPPRATTKTRCSGRHLPEAPSSHARRTPTSQKTVARSLDFGPALHAGRLSPPFHLSSSPPPLPRHPPRLPPPPPALHSPPNVTVTRRLGLCCRSTTPAMSSRMRDAS